MGVCMTRPSTPHPDHAVFMDVQDDAEPRQAPDARKLGSDVDAEDRHSDLPETGCRWVGIVYSLVTLPRLCHVGG
jgi:hypothetical protein